MTEENISEMPKTVEPIEKKKRVVRKKNDIYKEDQRKVVSKLNDILGISDTNNRFILEELKKDVEKQRQILELEPEVKKYFTYANWTYFKGNVLEDNKGICLMRAVYKAMDYEVNYKQKMKNGEKYMEYNISKKNL
jgi:hypothetical protein